ncbi:MULTISPECIES: hypothetical protein [Clostridium]|uniref:hypothetical protein n=1 Tax=Clostridium TaxID=1485 RepID=UPI00071C1F3D|nr:MULTISPECIES: hypothetical protein [Clostridium]MDU4586403.1 hypothetical protein [Clostridium sp.]
MEHNSSKDDGILNETIKLFDISVNNAMSKLQSDADKVNLLGYEIERLAKELIGINKEKNDR